MQLQIPVVCHPGIALTLLFDALIGNMVHNQRRRLDILLLILILFLIPGTVGNGADDTGQCDLHSAQKSQDRCHDADDQRDPTTAGPLQHQRDAAAQNAAADTLDTGKIQVRDDPQPVSHALILNAQVEDAAAEDHKQHGTCTAHLYRHTAAEGMDHK